MSASKKIIDQYNEQLFKKLFPDKNEPIYCNSVTDPNDEFYNLSFEEIAKIHLDKILEEEEFFLELETIKHNLKIE